MLATLSVLFVLMIAYWLSVAFFTAAVARSKNRRGFDWFIGGLLFNLIALIAVVGMPPKPASFGRPAAGPSPLAIVLSLLLLALVAMVLGGR